MIELNERPDFDEDPKFLDEAQPIDHESEISSPLIESDILGLIHIGGIEQTFEWGGHTFTMRTPKANGELAVAQIVNDYSGPMAQGRALMVAEVAASVVMVDGRQLYSTISNDESTLAVVRRKFNYIMEKWHWPVIEIVHGFCKDLQLRQSRAIEELSGK